MTRERAERTAWIAGGIGVVGSAIGWITAPRLFGHAWLAALVLWIGWPLGSMALLLIHSITGGRWGHAIRPQLALGVATLPLVLPAVIPLLVELHAVYPWARPQVASGLGNASYLNVPFFFGRGVLYFGVWLGLAVLIRRALERHDPEAALYRLAPFGLILLMLTVTFAAFDTTLSLDPHYNSSIYGMIMAAEGTLFALAIASFITLLVTAPARKAIEDLGKLMLGLLVLWGYFEFMQLLIVWNSDLAADAPWYVLRAERGWGIVAYIIFAVHFAIPFLLLIWPQVQRSRTGMMAVSAMIIGGEILRAWWLVLPNAERTVTWVDGFAVLAMTGLAVGMFLAAPRLLERVKAQEASHA